jgi:hypothetical protein
MMSVGEDIVTHFTLQVDTTKERKCQFLQEFLNRLRGKSIEFCFSTVTNLQAFSRSVKVRPSEWARRQCQFAICRQSPAHSHISRQHNQTYDDTQGDFIKLLIENGYLDSKVWSNATPPKYLLEVKTTAKDCGTRFYLSKSQYRRERKTQIWRFRYLLTDIRCMT